MSHLYENILLSKNMFLNLTYVEVIFLNGYCGRVPGRSRKINQILKGLGEKSNLLIKNNCKSKQLYLISTQDMYPISVCDTCPASIVNSGSLPIQMVITTKPNVLFNRIIPIGSGEK